MRKGISHTARLLQLAWAIPLSACIIPIPAEVEQADGGVNNTPFVKSANPAPPGSGGDLPTELTVVLEDGNVGDTLYIRVFREYEGTPFLDEVTVPNAPTGGLERAPLALPTNTWCNGTSPGPHQFEILVADRIFNPNITVQPAYRAVMQNGKFSSTYWTFGCAGL
jgi:hypothetical protein